MVNTAFHTFYFPCANYHRKDGDLMSGAESPIYKDESSKAAFADLSESSCVMITELEQRLQKETGEKVVLVAYRI